MFQPKDPNYEARVRASFAKQQAMHTLGIEVIRVAAGEVEFSMLYSEKFTQQNGFIHAGIITTALDSACGCCVFVDAGRCGCADGGVQDYANGSGAR
jgi:acyl-coenzyme A thioesterase PaaI-like protein